MKVNVNLHEEYYECGDHCCSDYRTITTVNGEDLDIINQDTATIIKAVLEKLGYEATVTETY